MHVLEYTPNEDWSLALWSGAPGLASRPKPDSTESYEDFESEFIPGSDNAGQKLKPLIAKERKYGCSFYEMRFSLRDYDMESGAFPIVFLGLMGIAVFI